MEISDLELETILHVRNSLLFFDNKTLVKKSNPEDPFDVPMGAFDSAYVCDLVGLFILHSLHNKFPNHEFGLYQDDGLCLSRNYNGQNLDSFRKQMTTFLKELGFNITIDTNLTSVDVTLDLSSNSTRPYHKPTEQLRYINTQLCHPPRVFQNLVPSISRRISNLSSSRQIFQLAASYYNRALRESGY